GSIGIELCSYGPLTESNGTYKTVAYGNSIPASEVTTLSQPFRGHTYYHKYSAIQLQVAEELILALCGKYGIPKSAPSTLTQFEFSNNALNLQPGVWTHVNARKDKSDLHP